jgi:hypothetical protein
MVTDIEESLEKTKEIRNVINEQYQYIKAKSIPPELTYERV